MKFERPYISPLIMAQITRHAYTQIRPTRECVGFLTVEDGIAVKYTRLRNWAKGDYTFRIHRFREGPGDILVHSHPAGGAAPSRADMEGANRRWLGRLYAIFVMPPPYERLHGAGAEDHLEFFVLHEDRKTFTHVT